MISMAFPDTLGPDSLSLRSTLSNMDPIPDLGLVSICFLSFVASFDGGRDDELVRASTNVISSLRLSFMLRLWGGVGGGGSPAFAKKRVR